MGIRGVGTMGMGTGEGSRRRGVGEERCDLLAERIASRAPECAGLAAAVGGELWMRYWKSTKGWGSITAMVSRRSVSCLVVIFLVFYALLTLSAGVARAEAPKLVSYGKFASELPFGIAVDQSSGNVYVAGLLSSNINEYDASGKQIMPPSPFGSGSGFYSGTAVNPTNGDLYVVDAEGQAIDTYEPSTGALLGSPFPVPGCGNGLGGGFTWVQIATDSAGNVYLPCAPENGVRVYNPSGTLLRTLSGSGANALSKPTGVAVGASGNVWVADDGDNRIVELEPSGAPVEVNGKPVKIPSQGVQALALDTHEDVFALVDNSADSCGSLRSPCDHVVEYSSVGTKLADVGAGELELELDFEGYGAFNMLVVNESSGLVYVTDEGEEGHPGAVWMFGPPTEPKIESELAVEVGTSEAKLGAEVNPGGIDAAYRFEYLTAAAYAADGESFSGPDAATSVPFPEGDAGTGLQPRTVWASASELQPGTTYHYRVVVTSELGTVERAGETFTTKTAAQAGCPNEQLRTGFSANLPDCRAYEVVTSPNNASAQPDRGESLLGNFAANDGNGLAYEAFDILPGSQSAGQTYLATRGASGWSSENEMPAENYYGYECPGSGSPVYSPDLSKVILLLGHNQVEGEEGNITGSCGGPEPEVVSGEPKGVENLFVRDTPDGAYQLVDVTPLGVTPTSAHFVGASADLSHVVFEERAKLTANALNDVENLYEWSEGTVRLVTVLPEGTPVAGSFAGISPEGSDIFFTAGGDLYARVTGAGTVQIDASQAGGSGGGGEFADARADGARVLFTDNASAGLTSDTVAGSGTNLYEYDLQSGKLTDLTPAAMAEVLGVSGTSEDSSYVFFAADGALTGTEANEHGEMAQSGQPNLYLRHGGTTTFIATLSGPGPDGCVWEGGCGRVSPSGGFFAFDSTKSLTGYDNTDAVTGESDPEIYLYNTAMNSLVCASCNPSRESPVGGVKMQSAEGFNDNSRRNLSEDGRVFFETPEALLPSDSNGQTDVYEYEPDGVGSCGETGGCLFLVSTGTGSHPTRFIDASANGDDVFLLDEQALVPRSNPQEARTIYDARVDGGFPEPSVSPPCITADSCRSAPVPQPSSFGAPSSQTFSGAGNSAPSPPTVKTAVKSKKCKKGFVKKKGKCVKSKGEKKKGKKSTARKASSDRRVKS